MTIREIRDGGVTQNGVRWRSTASFPVPEEGDPGTIRDFCQRTEEMLAAPMTDPIPEAFASRLSAAGTGDCLGREIECRILCRTAPFCSVVWDIRYGFGHTLLLWKRETQNWLIVPERKKRKNDGREIGTVPGTDPSCFLLSAPRLTSEEQKQVRDGIGGKPDGFFLTDSSFVFYRIVPPAPDRKMRRSEWKTLLREKELPRKTLPDAYRFLFSDSMIKSFSDTPGV